MKNRQSLEVIETIREAIEYLKKLEGTEVIQNNLSLLDDIAIGMQNVNVELFYTISIKGFDIQNLINEVAEQHRIESFLQKAEEWCDFVTSIIKNRQKQANELDERFVWLMV